MPHKPVLNLCLIFTAAITSVLGMSSLAAPLPAGFTYTYVLQTEKLAPSRSEAGAILRDCDRDLIVIDPFFSEHQRWSPEEIAGIRTGKSGRKVVAYLSIGEAENYRPYWSASWNDTANRPEFILEENPDWKGNFKVRYWDNAWQQIIFSELERIIAAGFDGVLLDIVDAFEFFEVDDDGAYTDYKINPDTGNSYRADMINFVTLLHQRAGADLLLIPQNAVQLLESYDYQKTISMQAVEDLFTVGNKSQSDDHIDYVLSFLQSLSAGGKKIILTEYPTKSKYRKIAEQRALKHRLTLLLTTRALDTLGKSQSATGKNSNR